MGHELMPPMQGVNPKGFFEDMDFVDMHIRLMRAHEDPKIEFIPDQRDLESYRNLIRQREATFPNGWGVKDPKMCFLLPYFLAELKFEPRIIVTRRAFAETVDSAIPLYGKMGLERAVTFQARYLYAMEKNLWNYKGLRATVEFDDLFMRAGVVAWRLCSLLGMDRDTTQIRKAAASVDPSLRHH